MKNLVFGEHAYNAVTVCRLTMWDTIATKICIYVDHWRNFGG